jgi:hypothetical protein
VTTPLAVIGFALIAVGGVWFLQGIGALPGSFMSGQTRWAVIGAIAAAVGVVMLVLARRR